MSGFSKGQQLAIGITPMFTGSLSAISSFTIIVMMYRSEQRLSTPYRRIIFGMSVFDIFLSVSMAFSSLPSPKGTVGTWNPQGNHITCAIQGFFFYTGCVGAPLYNLGLSVYYLCIARYEMSNEDFRTKVEQPFIHSVPIGYTLITGLIFVFRDLYHDVGVGCFLSAYPRGCLKIPKLECERGKDYRWYFVGYHQMAGFIAIVVIMGLIVWTIFESENRSRQYRNPSFFSANDSAQHEERKLCAKIVCMCCSCGTTNTSSTNIMTMTTRSSSERPRLQSPRQERQDRGVLENNDQQQQQQHRVSIAHSSSPMQRRNSRNDTLSPRLKEALSMALLYIGAYFITLVFPYTLRLMERYSKADVPFVIYILSRFFYPLQGFFNMLVYTRPHVKTLQRRHGYTWRIALWKVITEYGGEVPYNGRRRRRRFRRRRSTRLTPVVGYLRQNRHATNETSYDNNSGLTPTLRDLSGLTPPPRGLHGERQELSLNEIVQHDTPSIVEEDEENLNLQQHEKETSCNDDKSKQEEEVINFKDCLDEDPVTIPISFANLEIDENHLAEARETNMLKNL
mmetsp:Transcript_15571/g.23421  ORF Transcript_15571/g.23421 Transcript_15571/m.23421 type:complete len:566 (+) Transcript_15571:204-1901(+)